MTESSDAAHEQPHPPPRDRAAAMRSVYGKWIGRLRLWVHKRTGQRCFGW